MEQLLDVRELEVVYHTRRGPLKALHDVSFHVNPGEMVGIVGESGCGKSTVVSSLLRLLPPNGEITSGEIRFKGMDLRSMDEDRLRNLRGNELAMIFQDPMTSLNPVFTIGAQMLDVQLAHPDRAGLSKEELRKRSIAVLDRVGIPDAAERLDLYPHQFSGGMRQRIMIAMALMSRPALLIADEPTSALDVTLEAQILELLQELRADYRTAILFISHDLGVVARSCDRVVVMYAGRVVEQGDVVSIFERPQHPYTRALLAAVPSRRSRGALLFTIPGVVPSLSSLPSGCKFADRCADARGLCYQQEPGFLATADRQVRCHIYDPGSQYGSVPDWASASRDLIPLPALAAGTGENAPSVSSNGDSLAHPGTETPGARGWPGERDPLLKVSDLSVHFVQRRSLLSQLLGRPAPVVRAVDGVDFQIQRGDIVGLVGESGSGKTTLGKTILRLVPSTGGQIVYGGEDITAAGAATLARLRERMQMIFQDPYSSLSPRLRVNSLLSEPYTIHNTPPEKRVPVSELLEMVGLSDEQAGKYPHELSGGQARRVGIARALALRPEFLVADEPTSGLDVSVAASILNLMKELARDLELTYLIITHNLNDVAYISHRLAVMYLGKLVEVGPTEQLFAAPAHPYTLALLSAVSEPDPHNREGGSRILLEGEIPSPKDPPPGCRFHTRCPFAEARCSVDAPPVEEIEPGHQVACHFWPRVREQGLRLQPHLEQPPH